MSNLNLKSLNSFILRNIKIILPLFIILLFGLSLVYIPIVQQYTKLVFGWLATVLFILSYLAIIIVLLMIVLLKEDGRTRTGYAGNRDLTGTPGLLLITCGMIIIGSILSMYSDMPSWCDKVMCTGYSVSDIYNSITK